MTTAVVRPTRRDVSLRRRLGVMLAVAGVLVALLVVGAVRALVVAGDRSLLVTETYFDAITEAEADYVRLVDAESAFRGYLLTGSDTVLEPLDQLSVPAPSADGRGARLTETLGADHVVIQVRERARAATARWYDDFVVPMRDLVRTEGPGAVSAQEVERGTALFEQVRKATDAYVTLLRAERTAAMHEVSRSNEVLDVVVVLVALAAVLVGVALWVFTRRWVTVPLSRLADDARTVAAGDLQHVVAVTGPGEVGAVARDVEQMRVRLVELVEQSRRARAALEASHDRLASQAEDLRRSNRDLEEFAYVASHDLQEPLRKVASFTQLLSRRYSGRLDERADQYIDYAVDGARRMQRLVNDLLELSRVGRTAGPPGEVDLAVTLEQALGELAEPVERSQAHVTATDLPVVRGSEGLLRQLLVNLVGNAIKFAHPDRHPIVTLGAHRAGDTWELFCADDGIGIDPEHAEEVFVLFQRLPTGRPHEGTGIGLALCKRIVEHHGGRMWVDTGARTGAVVRWTMPVAHGTPGPSGMR